MSTMIPSLTDTELGNRCAAEGGEARYCRQTMRRPASFAFVALSCVVFLPSSLDYADAFAITTSSPINLSIISGSIHHRRDSTSLSAKGGGGGKRKKKASKSKGSGGTSTAQTAKGFGAPPPTYEEVLASFKTRVPDGADDRPCPCGSGGSYAECCAPFHRRERPCLTMTDVLRSRYSAFSWRIIDHVIRTTHPTCRDYRPDRIAWAHDLNKGGMFDSFRFVKLDPGPEEMSEGNEDEGYVEFRVTLRPKDDEEGRETVISERSRFLRDADDGSWSYASGDVRSEVMGLEDARLNA